MHLSRKKDEEFLQFFVLFLLVSVLFFHTALSQALLIWVLSLSGNLNKGMGIAQQHLYDKCETGYKNRRESNVEVQFRKTLSFLLL